MKKVQDLSAQRTLAIARSTDTVLAAAQAMTKQHIGALVVLNEAGALEGIITERDVMVRVVAAGKDPASTTVADVMTGEVYTTDPDQELRAVRLEMRERHIRHVPVVKEGRVLGVIGMRDLMRAALAEKREQVSDMTAYIRGEELA
ncbi:MAG: CBS domain-containing protein [Chlamydiales bacterium]|jgi:CBS domain-containing protein